VVETPPTLFHVSPSANRESIQAHGLDISRMSIPGIAGSPCPEVDGVFLDDRLDGGFWWASFGVHAGVDIWEVQAEGLSLEEHDDRLICRDVIPPGRLTLIEASVSPEAANARLGIGPPDRAVPGWDGYDGMP